MKLANNKIVQSVIIALLCISITFICILVFYSSLFKGLNKTLVEFLLTISSYGLVLCIVLNNKFLKENINNLFFLERRNLYIIFLSVVILIIFNIVFVLPFSKYFLFITENLKSLDSYQFKWNGFIFNIIIIAPIMEEIIFRGVILSKLLTTYSFIKSLIISTILFSIIHFNPSMIFAAIILSILSGWLF